MRGLLERAAGYRYGRWKGNPNGFAEDITRCAFEVFKDYGAHHQCVRKRGFGPDGRYCKQHSEKLDRD